MKFKMFACAALCALATQAAHAAVDVGVLLCLTGPAASIGIAEQRAMELLPTTVAGQKIHYIFMDTGADPTKTVTDAKRLIDSDKVVAVIGPSLTPDGLAIIDVVGSKSVPNISLAAGANIASPVQGPREWVFSVAQSTALMARRVVDDMASRKIHSVAFIGLNQAYGDEWWKAFSRDAKAAGIHVVGQERYSPASTSVLGQALHIVAAKPQAVLIAAAGTTGVLPEKTLRQVGFKGQFYQTHGVANPAFLHLCGKTCDGTLLPVAPGLVARQLSTDNPARAEGLRCTRAYEAKYGKGSVSEFTVAAWDAGVLFDHALAAALQHAKPANLVAFRAALRDAIEGLHDIHAADGVYDMSSTNHNGLDDRAVVMVRIEDENWKLVK